MEKLALHFFPGEEGPAHRLAGALGLVAQPVQTHRFPDGEFLPRVPAAAETVIVYRSLDRPNERLVELMLACDAWRRAGALRLVLVAPYLCYMRQDVMFAPGEPVSQRVVGHLLGALFERIVTVDPHLHRLSRLDELAAGVEWTTLSAAPAVAEALGQHALPAGLLVVGPDIEATPWAADLAGRLKCDYAVLTKTRTSDSCVAVAMDAPGRISGRPVLLFDDICSSGATLSTATRYLRGAGAASIDIVVTHALFTETALADLREAGARSVVSSDSCSHATNRIELARLLAETLYKERSS